MIDDIQYLIENSEVESHIIAIDSDERNRQVFSEPNNYTIVFEQEFKNVCNFDILDSTIPTAEYNVESHNNELHFTIVIDNAGSLTPIDEKQYIYELSRTKSYQEFFERNVDRFAVVGFEADLSPYLTAVSTPNEDYIMYYYKKSVDVEIKEGKFANNPSYFAFTNNDTHFGLLDTPANATLKARIQTEDVYVDVVSSTQIDLVYFEKNLIDANQYASIKSALDFIIVTEGYVKVVPPGNYDVLTLVQQFIDIFDGLNIDIFSTSAPPKKEGRVQFESSDMLIMNASRPGLARSLGMGSRPTGVADEYDALTIGTNFRLFQSVENLTSSKWDLKCPGLATLVGERFLVLRIPEVEDHMFGANAFIRSTPGVGICKLAAAFGGITNLRFDYFKNIKKNFHPIGKMSRVTIRFETLGGRLYNFRGVDHQIMAQIQYYKPKVTIKFPNSLLNPNYDPDVHKYLMNNKTIEYKEDSEEEDKFDTIEYNELYKKEFNRFNYLTSDDDDDSEISIDDENTVLKIHD